jgi:hypothetical protein
MRNRHTAGTDRWNARIEPFCREAQNRRGFIADVTRKLNDAGLPTMIEQQVRGWLVLDETSRIEPRAGMAELLLAACQAVNRSRETDRRQSKV